MKKELLQIHPAAVLISFISRHVQESESLYGHRYVSFTQTCHVLSGKGEEGGGVTRWEQEGPPPVACYPFCESWWYRPFRLIEALHVV